MKESINLQILPNPGIKMKLDKKMEFMKRQKLVLLLFFTFNSLFGQKCDCLKIITSLQQKVEANQASYQHQVIAQKRTKDYTAHKAGINNKASKITRKKDCIGLVSLYLSFFRDEHAFIEYQQQFKPKPNKILKPRRVTPPLPFGGLWYFQDGSFSINVFPKRTTLGEWVGVMYQDKFGAWKQGQIKIQFYKDTNGSLHCIYWRSNLIPRAFRVHLTDSTMTIGRNLIFYRKIQIMKSSSGSTNELHFKTLSDKTSYLKIPSFDLSFKDKIDSLILANHSAITARKNMIIDLRNNGGGGFDAFQSVLPYVLESNLTETPYYGAVWVSKDNFDFYDKTKYEYAATKQDSINELRYVAYLRTHLNQFTPIESKTDTIALAENAPLKVAIVFNRYTASSSEGFILQAKQAKKVTTFGENSAGAVSYGDWMPVDLPELNIWVALTTKKMIFKNNEDFESIGIAPDVDLTDKSEDVWLKIILEQLE